MNTMKVKGLMVSPSSASNKTMAEHYEPSHIPRCRQRNDEKRRWTTSSYLASASLAVVVTLLSTVATTNASSASSGGREQYLIRHQQHQQQQRRRQQDQAQTATTSNAVTSDKAKGLELKETNDDEHTMVKLVPFSLLLTNVSPSSPLAIVKPHYSNWSGTGIPGSSNIMELYSPEVGQLIEHVNDMGTSAFENSDVYGERFYLLDVGYEWSSDYVFAQPVGSVGGVDGDDSSVASSSGALPDVAAVSRSDIKGDGAVRRRHRRRLKGSKGTTILTLGHNGTVTFNGAYWEDNPTPDDLTSFLVEQLNEDANREELLQQIRPLVCTSEELDSNACNLGMEVMMASDLNNYNWVVTDDAGAVEDTVEENGALDATAEAEDGGDAKDDAEDAMTVDAAEEEDVAKDVIVIDEEEAEPPSDAGSKDASDVEEAAESSSENDETTITTEGSVGEQQATENTTDSTEEDVADGVEAPGQEGSKVGASESVATVEAADPEANPLTPVVVGSVVESPSVDEAQDSEQGNGGNSSLRWIIPVVVGVAFLAFMVAGLLYRHHRTKKREELDKVEPLAMSDTEEDGNPASSMAVQPLPGADWDASYDTIVGGGTRKTNNRKNATAVAAAAAAATATASSKTKKSKELDDILNYLSSSEDGDNSSFNSSSRVSGTTNTDSSLGSGEAEVSALAAILPPDEHERSMKNCGSSYNGMSVAAFGGAAAAGAIGKGLRKGEVQKQESFEGTYRTRSAMAKLNLKKDMLHVACDTHDAPSVNVGELATAAVAGKGYGISRTISPRKNASMIERQRLAERLSQRNAASGSNSVRVGRTSNGPLIPRQQSKKTQAMSKEEELKQRSKEEREAAKHLILPVDFKRSDSVDLESKSGNMLSSSLSEDEYSDLV